MLYLIAIHAKRKGSKVDMGHIWLEDIDGFETKKSHRRAITSKILQGSLSHVGPICIEIPLFLIFSGIYATLTKMSKQTENVPSSLLRIFKKKERKKGSNCKTIVLF